MRDWLIEVLEMARDHGCECYVTPADGWYNYGYILFPDGTIMYVQVDDYRIGLRFYINYTPSTKTGCGCSCDDEEVTIHEWDDVLKLKDDGLRYMRRLKAKPYDGVGE